jgi:hypothetical protein
MMSNTGICGTSTGYIDALAPIFSGMLLALIIASVMIAAIVVLGHYESWKIRTYKTAMLQALREYDMERS